GAPEASGSGNGAGGASAGAAAAGPSTTSPSSTSAAPSGSGAPSTATATAPSAPATGDAAASGVRRIESGPVAPVDLVNAAGGSVAKRVLPPVGILFVLLLLWRVLRRR
ncbi:MAG TPA: hypothetical protein VFH45_01870, partial [Acidimicrobiales bacterium]|nr:hypothetical protein [Acidimicrobiales bacterium]